MAQLGVQEIDRAVNLLQPRTAQVPPQDRQRAEIPGNWQSR
jgi:hypothetical protein